MTGTTLPDILAAFVATADGVLGGGVAKAGFVKEALGPHRLGVFAKSDTGVAIEGYSRRTAVVVVSLLHRSDESQPQTELIQLLTAYEPVHFKILADAPKHLAAFAGLGFLRVTEPDGGGMFADGFDDNDNASRAGGVFEVSYSRLLS